MRKLDARVPAERRPATAREFIEARRAAGLTQAEAAKLLGLAQPTISHLEVGRWPVTERRLFEMVMVLRTFAKNRQADR